MKWLLITFVVMCAFAGAMVPREMRMLDELENEPSSATTPAAGSSTGAPDSPSTTKKVIFCQYETPCGWIAYNKDSKRPDSNITNSYCICDEGTVCMPVYDDRNNFTYSFHCRPEDFEGKLDI